MILCGDTHTPLPREYDTLICMDYMFPRYFAETLLVPLALGIRPFALREARIVNPIDFPCLYRFRKYRLRAVGR